MKNRTKLYNFIKIAAVSFITTTLFLTATIFAKKVGVPTYINNAQELLDIRNNLSGHYLVSRDISLSELATNDDFDGWVPIGTKEHPFTGKIDFNGHKIADLYFSNSYLDDEFNKDNSDDILIGFLGCSSGILIHADFYRPKLPDLTSFNSDKNVVFGLACAINYGHVTSTNIAFDNNSGTFKTNNILCLGSAVGINYGQTLIVKVINTLFCEVGDNSVIGGVIGKCFDGSSNSFLFKGGYIEITSKQSCDIVCGGVVGTCSNSSFFNVYSGPVHRNTSPNAIKILGEPNNVICGGILGENNFSKQSIFENCYLYNRLDVNCNYESASLGGIIGYNHSSEIEIVNCVVHSSFSTTVGLIYTCDVISSGDSLTSFNNNYNLSALFPSETTNYYSSNTSYLDLSISKLNWPDNTKKGYWVKDINHFYLCIL